MPHILERPVYGYNSEDKKRKKPSALLELNPTAPLLKDECSPAVLLPLPIGKLLNTKYK